jgi:hypothetical protein
MERVVLYGVYGPLSAFRTLRVALYFLLSTHYYLGEAVYYSRRSRDHWLPGCWLIGFLKPPRGVNVG